MPSCTIGTKLAKCVAEITRIGGCKPELALFYYPRTQASSFAPWYAECGNRANLASLGEADGEYEGTGRTPDEALDQLLDNLKRRKKAHG